MPPARPNETPVKIDSLAGITINEIDWKPLIKDVHPKLDPLADKIPADQHVVFFPNFQAALAVADETNQHDTPVLRLAETRSENARVVQRYERQLGLSMSSVARLLGPHAGQERGPDRFRSVFPDGDRGGGAFRDAAAGRAGEPAAGARIAMAAGGKADSECRSRSRATSRGI